MPTLQEITRREPKSQGLAQLSAALQALIVAGDWLPLPLFTAHFGQIRPYKPWRDYMRAGLRPAPTHGVGVDFKSTRKVTKEGHIANPP